MREDAPWFVGKDICALLGLKNTRLALTKLTAKDRSEVYIKDATGNLVITPVISESGFIRLVGKCHKPARFTKPIKRWVAEEVLPSIKAGEVEESEPVVETKPAGKDLVNQVFDFKGHAVQVVMRGDVPWFAGKDVCDALEVKNSSQALSRLRDDERDDIILNDTIGRKQVISGVSESGLYKLIFRSRKPAAEPFVDWVTREVLPTIRKIGAYMTDDTLNKVTADPAQMTVLTDKLTDMKKERDEALKARNLIDSKRAASAMGKLGAATKKIKKLEVQVDFLEEDAPATTPLAVCEIKWIDKYFAHGRPESLHRILSREFQLSAHCHGQDQRYPVRKRQGPKNKAPHFNQ